MKDMRQQLLEAACAVRENAHAAFSNFKVGVALETEDGHIITGCNVENATYGLSICAERVAMYRLFHALDFWNHCAWSGNRAQLPAVVDDIGTMLRGEALLHLKQNEAAYAAFDAAVRAIDDTADPSEADLARATALLMKHSHGGAYTPRHRVPPEVWERLRLEDFLP